MLQMPFSFNSLYEILTISSCMFVINLIFFQFSLWDSFFLCYCNAPVAFIFQFSLWDSLAWGQTEKAEAYSFQFSLWDSGKYFLIKYFANLFSFNSLYEILPYTLPPNKLAFTLSILFMRFWNGLVYFSKKFTLSILFMRFSFYSYHPLS